VPLSVNTKPAIVDVMKRHRSEEFASLMLVMSGQKKNRLVRSLHAMAEALLHAWPSDDSEEFVIAVKTYLAFYGIVRSAKLVPPSSGPRMKQAFWCLASFIESFGCRARIQYRSVRL